MNSVFLAHPKQSQPCDLGGWVGWMAGMAQGYREKVKRALVLDVSGAGYLSHPTWCHIASFPTFNLSKNLLPAQLPGFTTCLTLY